MNLSSLAGSFKEALWLLAPGWNRMVLVGFYLAGAGLSAHAQTVANPGFETVDFTDCAQNITGLSPNTTYTLVG